MPTGLSEFAGAFSGEAYGDGPANASAGARNERRFTVKYAEGFFTYS